MLQALIGLAVLIQFNGFAIALGIASLVVVAIYPFMKRITDWPQLVLGLAFSWGALMGWAAEFADLDRAGGAALCRLASLWTIGYDTIYAHQDKEDDALVGVQLDRAAVRRLDEVLADRALRRRADPDGERLLGGRGPDRWRWPGCWRPARTWRARSSCSTSTIRTSACRLFRSNNDVGWLIFLGLIGGGAWMALKPLLRLARRSSGHSGAMISGRRPRGAGRDCRSCGASGSADGGPA